MTRMDEISGQLVAELQAWLYDAGEDCAAAPTETARWLHEAPREEIRRVRGYVKPNPSNDVAMFEAGLSHSGCPDWCEGCSCPMGHAPCSHCTDHEPRAVCGCPFYQLDDTGKHDVCGSA